MKLFIYGTLKRGYSRHFALQIQKFLGEVRSQPRYRMYNAGTYPALARDDEDGLAIEGELWEVDDECLRRLDEIEGLGDKLFCRAAVELAVPFEGEYVEAYFYGPSVDGLPDCGTRWE